MVINLKENLSTICFLVLLLVFISQFPTNELRVATNAHKRLRIDYDVQECLRNLVRNMHNFSNQGIRGQSFEQFKTFEPNYRQTYELQELTTDCVNQLRTSRFSHESVKHFTIQPRIQIFVNSCQFMGFGACVE